MKRTYYHPGLLVLTGFLFFTSCEKEEDTAPEPVARFTCPSTAGVGEVIHFTNESEHADSYDWDFGDGTASTAENPTHAYSQNGIYTVELTANGDGGTHSTTRTISVGESAPVVEFSMYPNPALAGE